MKKARDEDVIGLEYLANRDYLAKLTPRVATVHTPVKCQSS